MKEWVVVQLGGWEDLAERLNALAASGYDIFACLGGGDVRRGTRIVASRDVEDVPGVGSNGDCT